MRRESTIERGIKSYCDKQGIMCVKLSAKFFAGIPDRMVLVGGGNVIFFEIKDPKGKVSRIQSIVHSRLKKEGYRVEIVTSIEEAVKIISKERCEVNS